MYQDLPDGFVDSHDGVAVLDDELVSVLTWLVGQDFLVDTKGFIVVVFGVGSNPIGCGLGFVLSGSKASHINQ